MDNTVVGNENGEQRIFEYAVPYNHPVQVSVRAKTKTLVGIILIITGGFFVLLGVLAMSPTPDTVAIAILWGAAVLFSIVGILFLCFRNPAQKNDNKNLNFIFYDCSMSIISEAGFGRHKVCLYNQYKNKQYVKSITEMCNVFLFKILTGTMNGAPQYQKYYLPKDIVENKGDGEALREFLFAQKQHFYTVKEKVYK